MVIKGRMYSMKFASIYWQVLSIASPTSLKLAIYYKDNHLLAERPKWYKNINKDIMSLWRLYDSE